MSKNSSDNLSTLEYASVDEALSGNGSGAQNCFILKKTENSTECSVDVIKTADATLHMLQIILMTVSIVGCLLLLCLVARNSWKIRTPTNVLITSYIISDALTCCLLIPLHMMLINSGSGDICLNTHACKFYQYGFGTLSMAAIYTVFLLMLDAFYGLYYRIKHTFKETVCTFSLSFVWFFALAYSVWALVLYSPITIRFHNNVNISYCGLSDKFRSYSVAFAVVDVSVMLIIPICLIVILFLLMTSVMKRSHISASQSQSYFEVIRIGIVLTSIYTLTYLPRTLLQFVNSQDKMQYFFQSWTTIYVLELSQFLRVPLNFISFVSLNKDLRGSLQIKDLFRDFRLSWNSCCYGNIDEEEEDDESHIQLQQNPTSAPSGSHLLQSSMETVI